MKTFRTIEDYLSGSLDKKEKAQFEDQLKRDKELAGQVMLHAEVEECIRDHELFIFRDKLQKLGKSYRNQLKHDRKKRSREGMLLWGKSHFASQVFRSAAALLILVAVGLTVRQLFFKGLSSDELYVRYYTAYNPDVTVRAYEADASLFQLAIAKYQQGLYQDALEEFLKLTSAEADADLLQFYKGITCMELEQYEEALAFFNGIAVNWEDPHQVHREWYEALACLKTRNPQQALELFVSIRDEGGYYAAKASEIANQLIP